MKIMIDYKKIFTGCSFLFFGLAFYGCRKFVQIPPPSTQLVTASVFKSNEAVVAAQSAIYTKMWPESWNVSQEGALLSDELTSYSKAAVPVQYYTNTVSPLTAANSIGSWTTAYSYIYQSNAIIEGLQNNKNISPAVARQHTGESKFIRAFWHFYLANWFGDVPMVLTTDYTVNKAIARTPKTLVYQQIIADLKDAEANLTDHYVDLSDTTVTPERTRPNKYAAAALLARVYLYDQQFQNAETEASTVINNASLYSLCSNLSVADGDNYTFQANSTEAIWQIATPVPSAYNTPDGEDFYLRTTPGKGSFNSATLSADLFGSFEPNDRRFSEWVGLYTAPNKTKYYFPYKYHSYNQPVSGSSSSATEYVMVLRLAEQYLIRAEARAQQNNLSGAVSDLNVIRSRAGLPALSSSLSQAQALAAVMQERRVELFAEWGHRWFDLIRTGNINTVMSIAAPLKGGSWNNNGNQALLPVPESEILNDDHLTQNPGY